MLSRRLPWIAVLAALATAVVALFGPRWSTAEGENPLTRPTGADWQAIGSLAGPSVVVVALSLAALLTEHRPRLAALPLVLAWIAVVMTPGGWWFGPAALLATGAWGWLALAGD